MRKIVKNIKAKITPISIVVLMIMASITTLFLMNTIPSVSGATPDQFNYYKKITLDSDQVPSTLTNFPVLINVTDADLQSHVTNDSGWDIAFFNETNVQLNHEIELWNSSTGQLVAWVNVTSLKHDTDTEIYLYYGDSDISSSCENIPGTWDSHYLCVWHMDDETTSTVTDSIYNANGTKIAANTPVESDGKIGKAQQYTSDCGIRLGVLTILNLAEGCTNTTIEVWFSTSSISAVDYNVLVRCQISGASAGLLPSVRESSKARFSTRSISTDEAQAYTTNSGYISLNCWYYFVGVAEYTNDKLHTYFNGSHLNTSDVDFDSNTLNVGVSADYQDAIGMTGDGDHYYRGYLDEIRFSDIRRTADWIKTSYNNMNNASDGGFFTLDAEQGSLFSITGLTVSGFITWSGEGGETVWSNATSGSGGTLELNYNVSSDTNLTDIYVNMDADDMDTEFYDQNITVYVSFDNTTFAALEHDIGNGDGVCANGLNLTINATTWPSSDPGGDPNFPIDPVAGWENDTIYLRFTLAIPSGMASSTYSSLNTDWSIDWKYIR